MKRPLLLALPLISSVLSVSSAEAYTLPAALQPFKQTILLTDAAIASSSPPAFAGSVLAVDPMSGARTNFSDFTQKAQGPRGTEPVGVAVLPGVLGLGNQIEVIDSLSGTNMQGALYQVDPNTGIRKLLSDFGNTNQGPMGQEPVGITTTIGLVGLGATILVLDNEAGTEEHGALFSVDPLTGHRRMVSDFGDSAQGVLAKSPLGVVAAPGLLGAGTSAVLVVDSSAGTNGAGALVAIDFVTGHRTLLSDFGNSQQGPVGHDPVAVTCKPGLLGLVNQVFVLDRSAGTNELGAVFAVDGSGHRTLVSDFGNNAQGMLAAGDARQIAVGPGSSLLVTDNDAGTNEGGALFSVDPNTGARTLLSDFGNTQQGPAEGAAQVGIAVWPMP